MCRWRDYREINAFVGQYRPSEMSHDDTLVGATTFDKPK